MWWYLFQSVIMFAVLGSNIVYEWTPNPYVAGSVAGLVALAATVGINQLLLFLVFLGSMGKKRRA